MENSFKQEPITPSSSLRSTQKTVTAGITTLLYLITWILVGFALTGGVMLLLVDVAILYLPVLPHAPISAAPLLLIGAAYLGFQGIIRPKPLDLVKALIVSSAFICWGIDQLLPASWFATTLGDVVIVLYVIDLGWLISGQLRAKTQKEIDSVQ